MGLFNLLKNGLTIEKKKKEVVTEVEPDPAEAEESALETETPAVAPQTPEPVIPQTSEDKRKMAECILYGNTNPAPTPTPVAAPAPAVPETSIEPANTPVQQTYNAYSNVTANFNNALFGQTTANQNLLVISPKSPDEISAILSNLASGNACIVSLAHIADAQRHLDYICGFMNAIGGTIMQRTPTEYILTPKGVGIKS